MTKIKVILCDVWGVIHNGKKLHVGVHDFFEYCNQNNILVVLFSNAPRKTKNVADFLFNKFKLEQGKHYHDIITSGGVFSNICSELKLKKCFFIGQESNSPLMAEEHNDAEMISLVGAIRTYQTSDADFALILGPFGNDNDINIVKYLKELKQRDITAYCPNPDLVVHNNGIEVKCAGFFAQEYEKIGGKVIWYGKPYFQMYEYAIKKLGIAKNEIVAIGDSLMADISGANNFGIKSILTLTGITKPDDIKDIKPYLTVNNLFEMMDFIKNTK